MKAHLQRAKLIYQNEDSNSMSAKIPVTVTKTASVTVILKLRSYRAANEVTHVQTSPASTSSDRSPGMRTTVSLPAFETGNTQSHVMVGILHGW